MTHIPSNPHRLPLTATEFSLNPHLYDAICLSLKLDFHIDPVLLPLLPFYYLLFTFTLYLHPVPFTYYPLPCTLYPVPFTLYPIPFTLYPLPCTLYIFTLYPIPCTIYPVPSTLGSVFFSVTLHLPSLYYLLLPLIYTMYLFLDPCLCSWYHVTLSLVLLLLLILLPLTVQLLMLTSL
jgi:hypothetical protein